MQGTAWVQLLQRIPSEQHDTLVFMTNTGAEIMLQRLIRLEQDFVVALGRLSGSTEQGKVLVIPYDQLTYLSITKQLTDAQIEATLGKASADAAVAAPVAAPARDLPAFANGPIASDSVAATPSTVAPPPGGTISPPRPEPHAPPSKSVLLARLRQRLADNANKVAPRE